MGKDKSDKKERKEKKEKRAEVDGVKKPKKEKKTKLSSENIEAAFEEATKTAAAATVVDTKALVVETSNGDVLLKPVGALVPFANPLADEKVTKKVLKSVKKGIVLQNCCCVLRRTLTEIHSGQEQDPQARREGSR
jgi:H/ACA ribonucleoprotein complex subunit 2